MPEFAPSVSSSTVAIGTLLRGVSRRRGWQGVLAAASWSAGAVGIAALVALVVALLGGSGGAVIAAAGGALVVAGGGIVRGVLWPSLWRARSREWSARVVDRAVGGDAVWCAVELHDQWRAGAITDPWSVRRLESHLARTASALRPITAVGLVGWTAVERAALAGPAVLALAAAVWMLPGAAERLFGAFRPEVTIAPWTAQAQAAELALRDVVVELVPPAYTGEPARTLPSGSGAFAALPGTEVTVEAGVGAAVETVTFQLGDGPSQAGEVLDRTRVRVAFVVGDERSYRIRVVSPAREEPLESAALRIDPIVDQPPQVQLTAAPEQALDWDAVDRVALTLHAEDDYGLGRVEWVLIGPQGELARSTALRAGGAARSLERQLTWTPPAVAPGGGELQLALDVFDNDTVRGPKVTRTAAVPLRSWTAADRRQQVLDAQQQLFEQTLGALGVHLLWSHAEDRGAAQEASAEAARAGERMEAVLAAAADLRAAYDRDPEPDPWAVAATGAAVDEVARTWDLLRQRQRRQDFDRVDEVDRADLETSLGEHVVSLERAALVFDRLLATARWDAVRLASREAARAMQALNEAMASGDQAAVERALAELQRRMAELSRRIAELDRGAAREVANVAAGAATGPDLAEQVRRLMAEGRTAEAMELLSRSAAAMAQLEGMQGQPGMDPEEWAARLAQLDEAVDRAGALADRQEGLNQALEQLQKEHPDASTPAGIEKLRAEIAALCDQIAALERTGMDPRLGQSVRDHTGRAGRYLEDADRGLAWADADRALRGIARSDHEVLDLIDLAGVYHDAGATGLSAGEFDAYTAELKAAEDAHTELIDRLLAQERGWQQTRSEAALAGGETVEQQRALAGDAEAFRGDLDELGPMMGGGGTARRDLQESERWMRATATDAEVGRTERALDSGHEAASRMRSVERDLQSIHEMLQQGGQSGAMPMAMAAPGWQYFDGRHGQGTQRGDVEIPPPDRFQTPEELRRAALEAALEDAPPQYRELNDAYYEELLR